MTILSPTSVRFVTHCLHSLASGISSLQKRHFWKFTLAQSAVGGPDPHTASSLLAQGRLSGALLQNLIDQTITVIKNLRRLTLPEEKEYEIVVTSELLRLQMDEGHEVYDVSKGVDQYMGNAILKNWDPVNGRIRRLLDVGTSFRERSPSFVVLPEEEMPVNCLGRLLRRGSGMGEVFVGAPVDLTVADGRNHYLELMQEALTGMRSLTAKERVWTCGLTDAGLHNLFLSETDLWLFDLGEPQLMSVPGFLTKFLFSFFHTLGMEDVEGGDPGQWVVRFESVGSNLRLTEDTEKVLEHAYRAFEETLNRLILEVFDKDDQVRLLLIRYITVQLISDASFCLERWLIKGGGNPREENHQKVIEKWLWRALWDIYVAFDINKDESLKRFGVVESKLSQDVQVPEKTTHNRPDKRRERTSSVLWKSLKV